ncbi:MAG TPA: BrnT family toxin, partial [Pyrinomonadaceae bacterium]
QIFEAPMLVDMDKREDYDETRFIGVGFLKNIIVVIVFTEPDAERIRVISLRKALKYERERFEEFIRNELDKT